MEELFYSRMPRCSSYPRAFLGSVLLPDIVSVLLCIGGWIISAATLQIWARVLTEAGLVAMLSLETSQLPAFILTLDVCEKTDGFIQAQMKDDKQADAFAERRLSECLPETCGQNSLLIMSDERAASRFRAQHAAQSCCCIQHRVSEL